MGAFLDMDEFVRIQAEYHKAKTMDNAFEQCPYYEGDEWRCKDIQYLHGITRGEKFCLFLIEAYHGCTKRVKKEAE